MFIPLENGSVLWMSGVIAIYKTDAKTLALRDDGSCDITSFSPVTLKNAICPKVFILIILRRSFS